MSPIMPLPGDCFTNAHLTPRQRFDRNSRKPLARSATTNKLPSHNSSKFDPAYTINNPGKTISTKVRSLQSRKKENEHTTQKQQPHLANMIASRKPKHLDLMNAVSSKERQCLQGLQDYGLLDSKRKRGQESAGIRIKQMPQRDSSYRQIAYNEYVSQAFNLPNENRTEGSREQRMDVPKPFVSMSKYGSNVSTGSMEVPLALSGKDRRPKIQVMIPGKRPASISHSPLQSEANKQKATVKEEFLSAVSPPSSTIRGMGSDIAQARLSIVSPLSVVEMPKPRRPFSANSFETMTMEMPRSVNHSKSNSTDSSDDTSGQDDRSSNYSPSSSMSSLTSDSELMRAAEHKRKSLAFSIMSPTAAGVFDHPYPKIPRSMKSVLSLADKANRNKPLPPEPGLGAIAPLTISSSGSLKRRRVPAPLNVSRQSTLTLRSRHLSRTSSLRSKYTPADLDALDDAFLNQSPEQMSEPSFAYPDSPTLSQAEMALEIHLGTIEEDSAVDSNTMHVPLLHDPLQIRRGPMHMEPSRRAPPPPPSVRSSQSHVFTEGSTPKHKKLQKRSPIHVALQMRGSSDTLRRRISAPVTGSSVKASKILGQATALPMERDSSSESSWSPSESPHAYSDSSDVGREDSATPESDLSSSVPDAAFEEIRKRLEVLSPKVDATEQFLAFRERFPSEAYSIKLPLQIHSTAQTPRGSRPTTSHGEGEEIPEVPQVPDEYKPETTVEPAIVCDNSTPRIGEPDAVDDNDVHPLERRGRADNLSIRTRSMGSIAMSEIPDMYAALPSPASTVQAPMTQEEVERMISADAAEQVLLRILENLDNLQDLFATATVSRGFYRTFKRHELPLMKNALYGMSPAAWELREMSPPYPGLEGDGKSSPKLGYSPSVYLQHYMRDMYTMIALKSMILVHCKSFLRADTITALAGGETERASQIDDAFWRVWTFCRIFGCHTGREDDIAAQIDWLQGGHSARQQRREGSQDISPSFGQGNAGGLTAEDLYDMTEIWTCFGVLVRGFQGKRDLAREVGIFENSDITPGDVEQEDAALEEWTYHLLTLAPPVVLDVTSPNSPTAATFAHARSRGYTIWVAPPLSRSTFLKEAVSRVYESRMAARHPTVSSALSTSPDASPCSPSAPATQLASRQRCHMHAVTIRAKRLDPSFAALPASEERPMSNWTDIITKLDGDAAPPMPTTGLHTPAATPKPQQPHLTIPSSKSPYRTPTRPSPNLQTPAISLPSSIPTGPQVRDPVDVAVDRLVAMGFDERKAKKALADTDSGNSVDFDKAVEVLVRERKRDVGNLMHGSYRGRQADGEGASPVVEQRA